MGRMVGGIVSKTMRMWGFSGDDADLKRWLGVWVGRLMYVGGISALGTPIKMLISQVFVVGNSR